MSPHHLGGERQEQYQHEPQGAPAMSLRDDEGYGGERLPATLPYAYGKPAAQHRTTLSGSPGEHAAANPIEQLIAQVRISITVVLNDLDFVLEKLERARKRALKGQECANMVLNWVPRIHYVLHEEAQRTGDPIPPLLVSPQLESRLRRDLSDLEHLQEDLEGHAQAAQAVYIQLQRLRRDYPTLSPDDNSNSENQLQERLALLRKKRKEMEQQMTSLQSTHQRVNNWNSAPAAPPPETWIIGESDSNASNPPAL